MTHPYLCYIHNGLYQPGVDGCAHVKCVKHRAAPEPQRFIVFAGGATTFVKAAHQKQFEGDMDAYREARRQGVAPEQVTKKASLEALAAAEAA